MKIAFWWTIYTSTLLIQYLQLSPFCVSPPPYYLEPFIHSVAFLSLSIYQFLLMSITNINYAFIYKSGTLIAFDFSLTCLSSSLCLFWFPITFYEAKSMSPLCSFYLLTSSPGSCLSFHFALTIFSHCLQIVLVKSVTFYR